MATGSRLVHSIGRFSMMGSMQLDVETVPADGIWLVHLQVRLDRRETSELFLSGDTLISWPTEGLMVSGSGPMDRSGMFLSEVVARGDGLELAYATEEAAGRAEKILAYQVRAVFPEES